MLEERIEEVKKIHDSILDFRENFKKYNEVFTKTLINSVPIFTNKASAYSNYRTTKYEVANYKIIIEPFEYGNSYDIYKFKVIVKKERKKIFASSLEYNKNNRLWEATIDLSNPSYIVDMNYIIDYIETKIKECNILIGDI